MLIKFIGPESGLYYQVKAEVHTTHYTLAFHGSIQVDGLDELGKMLVTL